jgi:DNA-binding NtrC family response regulator
MRVPGATPEVHGHELEFIFHSLVELKLQMEDLRRRIEETPQRVEVIDVSRPHEYADVVSGTAVDEAGSVRRDGARVVDDLAVVYKPGMKMSEVERAAIEAALKESSGNRRRAAERLGIGERTLYRKIKEYGLD